jgi:carboxylesterase
MRPLGEALANRGHTVLGLRLPQHGTTPSDMFHAHASDWFQATLDGYQLLRDQCDSIFVMGLSMGGALCLWLAAQYPVAGVVAMSTPSHPFYERMDWRARIADWLGLFVPYVPKKTYPVTDPVMRAQRVAYPTYPTRSITQFRTVVHLAAQALPQVKAPVLLAHSRTDAVIPSDNLPYIYDHLGSADKEMLWLERSGHVITEEAERELLFERILTFIHTHATPITV